MSDPSTSQAATFMALLLLVCAAYAQKIKFIERDKNAQIRVLTEDNFDLSQKLAVALKQIQEVKNDSSLNKTNPPINPIQADAKQNQNPVYPATRSYNEAKLDALQKFVRDLGARTN